MAESTYTAPAETEVAPRYVAPETAPWYRRINLFQIVPWIALIVLGYLVWDTRTNAPSNYAVKADPNGVRLGRLYLPEHSDAYAKAVEACVQDILRDKSIEEAQDTLAKVDQTLRQKAYVSIVGPALLDIIPAGTKTLTSEQKDRLVSFLRGIAKPFVK